MAFDELHIRGKALFVRRAVIAPSFTDEKVLTSDLWDYVGLWLRRNANGTDAPFYWEQAREFYKASLGLPVTASPLTLYYCFLNATKSLLSAKGVNYQSHHGVTGASVAGRSSLANEQVSFRGAGVIPSLSNYLGEVQANDTYSLKDMFYNMPFIHRAYCLSYQEGHLFMPLSGCRYVRGVGMTEGWLTADLESQYNDRRILGTLPPGFERDDSFPGRVVIRKRQRFRWRNGAVNLPGNLQNVTRYHSRVRKDVTYIAGAGRWYLKRRLATATNIDRHTSVLVFAAMHRLSELSRYDPPRLSRLMESQRNWLIAEFIKTAPIQFLDEIACELTGQEIQMPGIHAGSFLQPLG